MHYVGSEYIDLGLRQLIIISISRVMLCLYFDKVKTLLIICITIVYTFISFVIEGLREDWFANCVKPSLNKDIT